MGGVWAGVPHTIKSHFGNEFLIGMEHSTPDTFTSIKGMDKYELARTLKFLKTGRAIDAQFETDKKLSIWICNAIIKIYCKKLKKNERFLLILVDRVVTLFWTNLNLFIFRKGIKKAIFIIYICIQLSELFDLKPNSIHLSATEFMLYPVA